MFVTKKLIACFTVLSSFAFVNAQSDSEEGLWMSVKDDSSIPFFNHEGQLISEDSYVNDLITEFSIVEVKKALPDSKEPFLQSVIEMRCDCDAQELKDALSKTEAFDGIYPAPKYELLNGSTNDYLIAFQQDYALDLINASDAWVHSTGSPDIVLGISDGGYYPAQEDLESEIVYLNNATNAPANHYYHGTAVAITAGGATNNNTGKSSIGYDCSLALSTIGYNQLLQLGYGGARVLNVSWTSGCYPNPYVQSVLDELSDIGVIVVAAAGNGNTCGSPTALVFPAACENVISVTSIGSNDNHEKIPGDPNSTHQHNSTIDLSAPGYAVPLGIAPGFYTTANGTSFAAPFVTGTIGLMLSLKPCLEREEIVKILKESATNIDALNPSYAGLIGAGRLNAGLALEYTMNTSCEFNNTFGSSNIESSSFGVSNVDVNSISDINVFPNPTKGTIHIECENINNAEIRIVDALNRIVDVIEMNEFDNKYSLFLDESGIYFVQIFQEGRLIKSEKISKV